MKLRRHLGFEKYIDFDPVKSHWAPAPAIDAAADINGVGDFVGDSFVALVRYGDGLEVYVGASRFDVQDPAFAMSYEHIGDSRTQFWVKDSRGSADITYPAWWVHSKSQHIAFGSSPDEDEDVCAYIVYMLNSESIRAKMVARFVSR